jgi:hypothetical protein
MMVSGINLADVVKGRSLAQLSQFIAGDSQPLANLRDELDDAAEVVAEVGMALGDGGHQHVGAVAPGGGASGLLLRVHGMVSLAHGLGGIVGSPGIATVPKAAEMAKPSPVSESARLAACSSAWRRVASAITQNSSPAGRWVGSSVSTCACRHSGSA